MHLWEEKSEYREEHSQNAHYKQKVEDVGDDKNTENRHEHRCEEEFLQ